MRRQLLIIGLFLSVFALWLLLLASVPSMADSVNAHPPLSSTTAYDQYYANRPWSSYAYTGGMVFTNSTETSGQFFHMVRDNNVMLFNALLHDGDSLNFTFTLRDGSALQGWMAKESTGLFNSRAYFALDGVVQTEELSKVLIFDIGREFIIQNYVYNVSGSDQQFAVGCNAAGLVVHPVNDINDTMTSVFVNVNTGSVKVTVLEHYWDGTITNSNGANWIPAANGTAVQVTPNNDAVQDALKAFFNLYAAVASLFGGLLFAVQLIGMILVFFFNPLVLLLILTTVELGASAVIFNSNKSIFIKCQRFGAFNLLLFRLMLELAQMLIGFFFYMLDIMAKIPDLIIKIVNASTDLIGKAVQIGIQIGTFLLLIPK